MMSSHKLAFSIFILALLIRLAYISFFPQLEGELRGDACIYEKLARSLSLGLGYPQDIRWPPLFPLFLAGIYRLFGHNFFVVRIIQAAIGSFTCSLVYLIGKKAFGEKNGFLSGLLAAFYPAFISYTGLLLTETLAAFLIATFLYFLMKATEYKNQWRWHAFAGMALGLVILCRSEMLLFPVFVLLGLLLVYKSKKQALIGFFILSGLAAIIILPWTVRNYISVHKFIPVTVGFGRTLWLGSYPEEWTEWHYDREPIKTLYKENTQIEIEEKLRKMAIENIRNHPFIYLKFSIKKFFRFWVTSHSNTFIGLEESFVNTVQNRKYKIVFQKLVLLAVNMGIILFGFFGIFLTRKRWRVTIFLSLIIIYKVLLHMALYSAARYQIPIMPIMLIFSAVGVQYLWYHMRHRDEKRFSIIWGNLS